MKHPALLLGLYLLLGAMAAHAQDLVVIAHPQSGVEQLSREQAVNIFMGRYRKLPSGLVAFPIDLQGQSRQRQTFYRILVDKSLAEVDSYWARLVFSGQTSPPLQVPDSATAVQLVASNRSAIAYVERAAVGAQVKVVLELSE